jgi:hypothetical protein
MENIEWTEHLHYLDFKTLPLAKGVTFFSTFIVTEGIRKEIFTNKPISEVNVYGYVFY